MGEDYYPIPWKLLKYDTSVGGYVVDIEPKVLEGAPAYAAGVNPKVGRPHLRRRRAPSLWDGALLGRLLGLMPDSVGARGGDDRSVVALGEPCSRLGASAHPRQHHYWRRSRVSQLITMAAFTESAQASDIGLRKLVDRARARLPPE